MISRLGDVCDIINGYAFQSEKYVDSGVRIIRIANVQKGYIEDNTPQFYPVSEMVNLKKYALFEGDLLISLTGNVGRVAILSKEFLPAALNQRVACLRIKNENQVYKPYLFHVLNSSKFETLCIDSSKGVAQKNMSTEWLKEYQINIPQISQQKLLAELLDRMDKLIKCRKKQLQKLDDLVKARFVEMFGDVIQNSKGWKRFVFSDIATSRLGKMLDAKQQTGKSSFPYLANFNVQWFRFSLESLNKMDFDEEDQKEFALIDGDLLVCEGGEIGRCAIWHNELQPCFFQKALHRVRCNIEVVLPDYLARWFQYNCEHGGFASIEGAKATIAHLPGAKLKALQVSVPPIDLQQEFVAFVTQIDKSKLPIQQSLEKLEILKQSLMQQYFE